MEAAACRAHRPGETPLYALLESLYETVKGARENLFERPYGFWRGVPDGVVARHLDCGVFERGFARVRCADCAAEVLLAFSCKGRGLSSSTARVMPGCRGSPPPPGSSGQKTWSLPRFPPCPG